MGWRAEAKSTGEMERINTEKKEMRRFGVGKYGGEERGNGREARGGDRDREGQTMNSGKKEPGHLNYK